MTRKRFTLWGLLGSKPKPKPLGFADRQIQLFYHRTSQLFRLKGRARVVSVKAQMGFPVRTEQEFLERIAVLIHALVLADDLDGAVEELKKLRDTPLNYGQ
jgi:hypothetical protein